MEKELEKFLEDYFALIKKVNEFHYSYLISNKFKFPKTDYIELKRFIDTATNFLTDIDKEILDGVAGKLYQDVTSLYDFYKHFSQKSKYTQNIFYQEYLENINNYKKLKDEVEKLKASIEKYTYTISTNEEKLKTMSNNDKEYKKTKKLYVDAIYELSITKDQFYESKALLEEIEKKEEKEFFPKFNKLKQLHLLKLKKIINTKLFYFDKILWYNASKSELIIKFFNTSDINGDFSTKTFIQYFLKNIDMSKSHNSEWLIYLQKMLKVIE